MDNQNQNNQNDQQNDAGKEAKKFAKNMERLAAVLGGNKSVFEQKLQPDGLTEAVNELIADQKEDLQKKFKEDAKSLIADKIAFDKLMAQKLREMEGIKTEKMKEFNKKASALFNQVADMNGLEQAYRDLLQGGEGGAAAPAANGTEEEPVS